MGEVMIGHRVVAPCYFDNELLQDIRANIFGVETTFMNDFDGKLDEDLLGTTERTECLKVELLGFFKVVRGNLDQF